MPNRIIKESICYSDDLDQLTAFEENVFYRLLVRVDDYGRIDARPSFLKSTLYVTKSGISEKNVSEAVARLSSLGLVKVYTVEGKPFLCLPKWHLHQRVRDSKEKYPAPPENDDCEISPQLAATRREPPPYNPNPNPNPNPNRESESEILHDAEAASFRTPEITLPLNDGSEFPIYGENIAEWEGLYPAVDVPQQLRNMRGWILSNPAKRKTKNGIKRFITGWLGREQDKGFTRKPAVNNTLKSSGNPFLDRLAEIEAAERSEVYAQ